MFECNHTQELQLDLFESVKQRQCKHCHVSKPLTPDNFAYRTKKKTAQAWKCNTCASEQAKARNDKANAKWLEKYGVTRTAVGLFINRRGYKGLSEEDRVGLYFESREFEAKFQEEKLAAQRTASVLAKHDRLLCSMWKRRELKDTRLTLNQAWADWRRISPPEWWADRGMMPHRKSFCNAAAYARYKSKVDPDYRLRVRTRASLRRQLRGVAFSDVEKAVWNSRKTPNKAFNSHVEALVGYNTDKLWDHIRSQFTDGMCWERMSEIHIDHIIPVSWFDFHKRGSDRNMLVNVCWCLDNLRPMWAADNIRKSNNVDIDAVSEELMDKVKTMIPSLYERLTGPSIRA